MKVVLIDTIAELSSWIDKHNGLSLTVELKKDLSSGSLKRKRDHNRHDEMKDELISDVIGDPRALLVWLASEEEKEGIPERRISVNLRPMREQRSGYSEKLYPHVEKVTFSVHILYAPKEQEGFLDFLSIEGMELKYIRDNSSYKYWIMGSFKTNKASFDLDPDAKIRMKILAQLPDNIVFPDNIPLGRKILEAMKFSDLTITAANGTQIQAHKVFLANCSPVLEAMFETGMKESRTGQLDMTDVSEEGGKAFLQFAYYGDVTMPEEDAEVGFELLYLAHKYGIGKLEAMMLTCLIEKKSEDLSVELALEIYLFLKKIESAIEFGESAAQLKEKIVKILRTNAEELKTLQKYKDLLQSPSESEIATALSNDLAKSSPD